MLCGDTIAARASSALEAPGTRLSVIMTASCEIVTPSPRRRTRHRLSRAGDRQLNSAIRLIAVTQVRMRNSIGRRYYDTKIAEGKTRNEALRARKATPCQSPWRLMIGDERRRHTDGERGAIAAGQNTEEPWFWWRLQISSVVDSCRVRVHAGRPRTRRS